MVDEAILDLSCGGKFKLDNLCKEQEAVLEAGLHSRLVEAGPATGKTRVTANFTRHLLNLGMDACDILVVSFTNSAVEVFKRRLDVTEVSTIHSHGYRHSDEARKRFLKTGDFDSLLVRGDRKYPFVICDEAQDLTRRQYDALMQKGKNHLLVGDKWQSMYTWSGADPTVMDDFEGTRYPLICNHRSKENIVKVGNIFSGREMTWEKPGGLVQIGWDEPPLDNLTILSRTNRRVDSWSEYLKVMGVPHTKIVDKGKGRETSNFLRGDKESLSTLVCTIHCSKGDEWDRVLLDYHREPFMDDDVLEKRVFYVGLTRAKNELFIIPNHYPFVNKLGG